MKKTHLLIKLCILFIAAQISAAGQATAQDQKRDNPQVGELLTMTEVVDFYRENVPFIRFDPVAYEKVKQTQGEWIFEVQKTAHWGNFFYPAEKSINPYTTEEQFFSTDIAAYTEHFQAANFLEAKKKAYGQYPWLNKRQRYDQDLLVPSFWSGLNHPPIRNLQGHELTDFNHFFDQLPSSEKLTLIETQKSFDQLSQTELSQGNQLLLLPNNRSIEQRTQILQQTEKYFFASVMYFSCKGRSGEFLSLMMDKARKGIQVFFLVEGLYTLFEQDCIRKLKDSGVKMLAPFTTLAHNPKPGVMHNKIWIADGQKAVLGGQNLLNSYVTSTGLNNKNRDTDIYIDGPVVRDLTLQYMEIWEYWCTKRTRIKGCDDGATLQFMAKIKQQMQERLEQERWQGVRGAESYPNWGDGQKISAPGVCRVVLQFPGKVQKRSIGQLLTEAMSLTTQSAVFTTPDLHYQENLNEKSFVRWNTKFVDLMNQKAREGKTVAVLTNGFWGGSGEFTSVFRNRMVESMQKDNPLFARFWEWQYYTGNLRHAKGGSDQMWKVIEEAPVEIWTYFQYSHSKVFLFDQTLSVVSSFNMDNYSSHHSYETALFCLDNSLSEALKEQLTLDFANALPVIVPEKKQDSQDALSARANF